MKGCLHLIFCLAFAFVSGISLARNNQADLSPMEQKARFHLDLSDRYLNQNLDSSLRHALIAKSLLPKVNALGLKANILNNLGEVYRSKGDLDQALTYYLESGSIISSASLKQPGDLQLTLLKSDVLLKTGTLYLQLQNFAKSLAYYNKSLALLEKVRTKVPKKEVETRKLKIFNNMAAVFLHQKDFETALVYFKNALESNKTGKNPAIEGSLLNNIGICYLEKKEHDLASHYFQQSLKIRTAAQDKKGQAQALNNIGKNEVFKGNFREAKNYFSQALALSRQTGSPESALISLQSLSLVSDTLQEYKAALEFFKQYKALNDSVFNLESRTAIAKLEEQHKRVEDKKKYELKLQRNESDRLKSQMRNIILFGVLIFLLSASLFFITVMRGRVRNAKLQQEKLHLEQENLKLEHQALQESLEFKERELTANALNLLKNNELNTKITESLHKLKSSSKKENQDLIQELISELRASQNDTLWEEFELHFTKVHSHFYQALQEKFPALTSNEKKLCAFLRLNMSTKDISGITRQSVNSITVARSRLRKKLNIEGEDIHLVNFLMEL